MPHLVEVMRGWPFPGPKSLLLVVEPPPDLIYGLRELLHGPGEGASGLLLVVEPRPHAGISPAKFLPVLRPAEVDVLPGAFLQAFPWIAFNSEDAWHKTLHPKPYACVTLQKKSGLGPRA